MKKFIIPVMLVLLILVCSCAPKEDLDIIPVQFIFSGDTAHFATQDMFYAEKYDNITFREHPHLQAKLSQDASKITMYASKDFSGYTTLTFLKGFTKYEMPVKVIDRKYIDFNYTPKTNENIENICVFGNFNFWLRNQLLMQKADDGRFSITLPFEPGQYEYLFAVNGREILDPSNPDSVPNGLGGYNSPLKVLPSFSGKTPFITPKSHQINKDLILRYKILTNDYKGRFLRSQFIVLLDNKELKSSRIKLNGHELTLRVPLNLAKNSKKLRVCWSSDICTSNLSELILEEGLPAGNSEKFHWQDAIIYSLMVDRFKNGDPSNDSPIVHGKLADRANFQGGDLQGLIQKMDENYFNDLGVNTLWVLPILKNTPKAFIETPPPHRMFSGYHGYWPINNRKIDPHYGTNEDAKTMVDIAHKKGIKILMDYVSNHVHKDHPYYQEHPEWFGEFILPDGRQNLRLFDEYRLSTWFESYLPSFDYFSSPEAIDTMVTDAIWLLKEFNIDGFRHDAVKHVPYIFWRTLSREIRREFPDKDIYQIGETFGDHSLISSYVNNGQLSAQFNFNLYWPARYAFAVDNESFDGLAAEMERVIDIYGQNHLMANMMDSHDQPRYPAYLEKDLDWGDNASEFGWHHDIQVDDPLTYDKIEMYYSYLMTIPGPPVIYYGNEVGLTGAGDPDNRRPMPWKIDQRQKELRQYISALTAIRKEHPALRYGDYFTVRADETVYAYLRSDFNERMLVVIHRKDQDAQVSIELSEDLDPGELECLNESPDIDRDPENKTIYHIQAKPYTGYIFKVK
ncbi:MAG: alpha-amylase family glycosyl hydrolase [Candidatus Neomarinimicrobiota bacterium]